VAANRIVFWRGARGRQAHGVLLYGVSERKSTWLDRVMRPIEKLIYRVCGVDETQEMRWTEYGAAMPLFSGVSLLLL
jgi:potassium-transporting ATPase potassium-binding subunit